MKITRTTSRQTGMKKFNINMNENLRRVKKSQYFTHKYDVKKFTKFV